MQTYIEAAGLFKKKLFEMLPGVFYLSKGSRGHTTQLRSRDEARRYKSFPEYVPRCA